MLLFNFGSQYRDSLRDISLYFMLRTAEQGGNGHVKNECKRDSRAKRGESVALLNSAHVPAPLTSQQKGYVLLA
jgi:hypothetical protein